MKFKVGDRVVIIRSVKKNLHKPAIVTAIDVNDSDLPYEVSFESERKWAKERSIEHEAIYNSPLYQALI